VRKRVSPTFAVVLIAFALLAALLFVGWRLKMEDAAAYREAATTLPLAPGAAARMAARHGRGRGSIAPATRKPGPVPGSPGAPGPTAKPTGKGDVSRPVEPPAKPAAKRP